MTVYVDRPTSHYDLTESSRREAVKLGAVEIGYMSRESMDLLRRKRDAWLAAKAERHDRGGAS